MTNVEQFKADTQKAISMLIYKINGSQVTAFQQFKASFAKRHGIKSVDEFADKIQSMQREGQALYSFYNDIYPEYVCVDTGRVITK